MKCALCGTENDNGVSNCTKCGYKFNNSPVSDILNSNKIIEDDETEDVTELQVLEETVEEVEKVDVVQEIQNEIEETIEELTEAKEPESIIENIIEETVTAEEVNIEDIPESEIVEAPKQEKTHKKPSPKNAKEKFTEIFSTKNVIFMAVGVVLVIFLVFGMVATIFQGDKSDPKVIFESLGTYYVSDPDKNSSKELVVDSEEFDLELVKTSNNNEVFYYPSRVEVVNGVSKLDVTKTDLEQTGLPSFMTYEDYFVSYDGRYAVYCENVSNFYGNTVADIYLYDEKQKSTETNPIAQNVIIDSIKLSNSDDDMIYITADDNALYRYDMSSKKSKDIDVKVDEVLFTSDDLEEIIYVKLEKNVDDFNIYDLYSCKNNSKEKIANSVIKESVIYNDSGVLYLQIPENYPSFNVLENATKNLNRRQIKELKTKFDEYCTKSFFTLGQVDFDGKNEKVIAENVYLLNFVSEDGKAIILTKFKNLEEIDITKIKKIDDILSPICLDTYFVDEERILTKIDRTGQNTLLSVDENFGYDADEQTIFYLDGNIIKKLSFAETLNITDVDGDVSKLWYDDGRLVYMKSANTLMEVEDDKLKVVSENVLEDNVYLEDGQLYFEVLNKDKNKIELYAKVSSGKAKKISGNLGNSEIAIFDNYIYFEDADDGLCYFNGKNVKKVDKNATQVYVIE